MKHMAKIIKKNETTEAVIKALPKTSAIPTIAELFSDNIELAFKNEQLNLLLNQEPKKEWVKVHPFISNYLYIPIDKIEYMLRKIFKQYKIEVRKSGMLLNAVEVHVRVHYLHPVTGVMEYHDGVGACEVQTMRDSGHLKIDMSNINRGAVTMALPIAKTVAVKDACDHFGKLFGSDLNRKDTIPFTVDQSLTTVDIEHLSELFELKRDSMTPDEVKDAYRIITNKEKNSYTKLFNILKTK